MIVWLPLGPFPAFFEALLDRLNLLRFQFAACSSPEPSCSTQLFWPAVRNKYLLLAVLQPKDQAYSGGSEYDG